jgi:pyruvate dehydrogenase E2 component (dihydrolipoamide acetyltransferase)
MAAGKKGQIRLEEPDQRDRVIIRRGAESRATVPDLDITAEAEMGVGLSPSGSRSAVLVKACALALRETPRANASYRDGRFELYSRVNVAVSSGDEDPGGSPIVFDADQKSLGQIDEELAALGQRARQGRLSAPERTGATFTLLDLEKLGAISATPLVVPPQAAALAAGVTREAPGIEGGALVSRKLVALVLAFDQRILHLSVAAAFLSLVKVRLEDASGPLAL